MLVCTYFFYTWFCINYVMLESKRTIVFFFFWDLFCLAWLFHFWNNLVFICLIKKWYYGNVLCDNVTGNWFDEVFDMSNLPLLAGALWCTIPKSSSLFSFCFTQPKTQTGISLSCSFVKGYAFASNHELMQLFSISVSLHMFLCSVKDVGVQMQREDSWFESGFS